LEALLQELIELVFEVVVVLDSLLAFAGFFLG